MKFKYGNFTDYKEKNVRFTTSMFEQFVNTDNFTKDMTLEQVATKIKEFLKMENGEVELIIGFKYHKKEGEANEN